MKRKIFSLICILFLTTSLFAQSIMRVGVVRNCFPFPVAYLEDQFPVMERTQIYTDLISSSDDLVNKFLNGDIDVGFIPLLDYEELIKYDENVEILGVYKTQDLVVACTDRKISSVSVLKGQKVYIPNDDKTADYLFRKILKDNNISIGNGLNQVEIVYSYNSFEIINQINNGNVTFSVLNKYEFELIKKQRRNSVVIVDFNEELKKTCNQDLGCFIIIGNKDFIKENKTLVNKYLKEYKYATEWVKKNPVKCGYLCDFYNYNFDNDSVYKSADDSSLVYYSDKKAEKVINYTKNVLDSIGER